MFSAKSGRDSFCVRPFFIICILRVDVALGDFILLDTCGLWRPLYLRFPFIGGLCYAGCGEKILMLTKICLVACVCHLVGTLEGCQPFGFTANLLVDGTSSLLCNLLVGWVYVVGLIV